MTQAITTTGPNAVATQAMVTRVAALHETILRDPHYRDTLPVPLAASVRKDLDKYRLDLHARLRPISMASAERDTVRKGLGILLQSYNSYSSDPKGTLDAYCAMLSDQPAWAILDALADFRDGRVYDTNSHGERVRFTLDKAPTATRILDQVKKHTDATEAERARVVRLLAVNRYLPPPVPEAERERVGGLMQGLASGMAMTQENFRAQDRAKTRAEADEARERARRITEDARNRRRADDIASQDRAASEAHAG